MSGPEWRPVGTYEDAPRPGARAIGRMTGTGVPPNRSAPCIACLFTRTEWEREWWQTTPEGPTGLCTCLDMWIEVYPPNAIRGSEG